MVLNASYNAKQGTIQCFGQEGKRYQENEGKRVFSLVFLDPSSPRLSSGLLGPPKDFNVKKPARLGKLIAS